MTEPVSLSTHYGDYKGRAWFDVFDDGTDILWRLAARTDMPKGYWPVGFSIFASVTRERDSQHVFRNLSVFAVDTKVAAGPNELAKYAKQHQSVPVFRFSGDIAGEELLELFLSSVKELDVVMQTRIIDDAQMMQLQDN